MAKDKTPQLRKQVHKLFGDNQVYDDGYQSCYDGKWIDMTDEVCAVADFIAADRKRVELEARLNEVQNAYEYWINGTKFISSYFRDRIAELSNIRESKDE